MGRKPLFIHTIMWSYIKFMMWAMLWIPIWCVTRPFKGRKDNCLNWAINQWDKEGGYLVIRWCRHNKWSWINWPHFMWMSDEFHANIRHIIPIEESGDRHSIPCPWFKYEERHGDKKDDVEN